MTLQCTLGTTKGPTSKLLGSQVSGATLWNMLSSVAHLRSALIESSIVTLRPGYTNAG